MVPNVTGAPDDVGYIRRAVRFESGAKSALDPNAPRTVVPDITDDLGVADFSILGVTTAAADRTLWDKVVIPHGIRSWFEFVDKCARKVSVSLGIITMFTAS